MRRLLTIFLVLAALGAALAALGVALARGRSASPGLLGGPRVVALRLGGEIPDYRPAPPLPWLAHGPESHLAGLWRAFVELRRDPGVRALAVRIDDVGAGLAKAQELRRQLAATASAGKSVACQLDTAGEGSNGTLEYYLASACTSISLSPAGELNLLGLFADPLFLRGTLDKLKIEPDFLAVGRYKSFGETFTETGHSPAAREALEAVLDGYWRQLVGDLAAARRLTPERVRALVDRAPLSAAQALAAGLVDRLEYADELRARLDEELGGEAAWVELADYVRRPAVAPRRDVVAVVFAQGSIVRGDGGAEPWTGELLVGSQDLGDELAELAEDDRVAAVVLRVDSGGGSAIASDLLHRSVARLRSAKPVVVSMSDLAASGGYYLAAGASRIVAEPATLTGSIGVVSGKLATGRLESEHLGATRDPLARGARAGIYSSARPFDDDARAVISDRLGDVYDRFLEVVAAGRDLPRPTVERLAEGRVWVGEDAARQGLVDALGGLDAAVAAARELAGLPADDDGPVRLHPRDRGFWEWLAESGAPLVSADAAPLADLVALRRDARLPGTLELPRALRALARPF
jgi:protease-4